jgi:hypothetical protein
VPEYFVRVETSSPELGIHHESAEKAYASSAAEAAKVVEARHESHDIKTDNIEYTEGYSGRPVEVQADDC